jgi:hypothetical protein
LIWGPSESSGGENRLSNLSSAGLAPFAGVIPGFLTQAGSAQKQIQPEPTSGEVLYPFMQM